MSSKEYPTRYSFLHIWSQLSDKKWKIILFARKYDTNISIMNINYHMLGFTIFKFPFLTLGESTQQLTQNFQIFLCELGHDFFGISALTQDFWGQYQLEITQKLPISSLLPLALAQISPGRLNIGFPCQGCGMWQFGCLMGYVQCKVMH